MLFFPVKLHGTAIASAGGGARNVARPTAKQNSARTRCLEKTSSLGEDVDFEAKVIGGVMVMEASESGARGVRWEL